MTVKGSFRLLLATQSGGLRAFDALAHRLSEKATVENTGFTVADRWFYHNWLKENPDYEHRGNLLLKEWDITADPSGPPDLSRLRHYEETLAQPAGLFGAIVADRRLTFGPNISLREDNRRRFTDQEIFNILIKGCEAVEKLYDELNPNLVIGFVAVTMVEYLVYLFARARGIRYLNIKPSRIGNRMLVDGALAEPGPLHATAYNTLNETDANSLHQVREIITGIRQAQQPQYEGSSTVSSHPAQKILRRRSPIIGAARFAKLLHEFRSSGAGSDNHCTSLLSSITYLGVVNPLRARWVAHRLKQKYVTPDGLKPTRYAFYPLHADPEMATLVYSRPHLNQIEIIRVIAASLPADMILVTKEHPWMVGKRNLSTYQRILDMPRVRIASPRTTAREWIDGAAFVAVLTSSVALEAAIRGRPVLTLGNTAINLLPDTMVKRCRDWTRMPQDINALLAGYQNDESAIEKFIAATVRASVSINWYSEMLGRGNVHRENQIGLKENIDKLANYILETANAPWPREPVQGACDW